MKQSIKTVPWYRKDQRNEPLPMPVLGPDLYNPQDYDALKKAIEAARSRQAARWSSRRETRDRQTLYPCHLFTQR